MDRNVFCTTGKEHRVGLVDYIPPDFSSMMDARVATAMNIFDNRFNLIDSDDETKDVMLNLIDAQLIHIIELSHLNKVETEIMQMTYFTKRRYAMSTIARNYCHNILKKSWKEVNANGMSYIIDRIFRTKIVDTMIKLQYFD